MGDGKPPDFAMLRAVEILAQLATGQGKANVPPPPLDRPVVLFNETQAFAVGTTPRREIERTLGPGFPYPVEGWHTWAILGHRGQARQRWLLSAFFRADVLLAVEHYLPKGDSVPALAPRDLGRFRLVPGEIGLGTRANALGPAFVPARGGPGPIVYELAFEARYPGGVAYAMGNYGAIERVVLYAAI